VQHEIDHLDGIVFIDHLSRLKKERDQKKLHKLKLAAKKKAEEDAARS
jgi:peptide deformylase